VMLERGGIADEFHGAAVRSGHELPW
jgi:hypothetical protein